MKRTTLSERALVLAPRGRDAAIAVEMAREAGIEAAACASLPALITELDRGAALVIVTEEAVDTADLRPLSTWIEDQEEWSDLPFILLTNRGGGLERNPAASRYLGLLGNVTFLERPFHPTTLISLARSALRGRQRQYEARTRLVALREGEARYRTLFEAIDAGFCIIEMLFEGERAVDYRFVEVNPAFARQTGLTDPVGRRIRELAPTHEQHWFDIYGRVAVTGEPVRIENEAAALGRWFDVHAFRVGEPGERRVAVLFNDISERRNAELALREINDSLGRRVSDAIAEREMALAQLHEAQKLETVGQLTGGVAHDFNNLLTPITGALDLLERRYGDDPRSTRLIEGALESAERAKILVQRLLQFARRQALETRAIDIAKLIADMRDLISSSVGGLVELEIVAPDDLPPASADPNQLELAILNLCVNARDAMPAGGLLTVAVEQAVVGPRSMSTLPPGAYLRLSVVDTGIGMDEATLARAVEPFYSTKELGKGTGLGLSMVHGLAAQLGGAFIMTSQPGQGTRADLYLPVADGAVSEAPRRMPVQESSPGRCLSILLVDDEDLVRAGTAEMLREMGHRVTEASGGAEALAALQNGVAPDAVVTDYMMPRMNGGELATRLHAQRPRLPVLVVTGYAGGDLELNLPQLPKPFRQADLAAALTELVGQDG